MRKSKMRRLLKTMLVTTMLTACVAKVQAADTPVILVPQGTAWTNDVRKLFYSTDQGSQVIPLTWMNALHQPNGQPFLADSLDRYGYLANPDNTDGLPIGFTAAGPAGAQIVGMTCSACHTRQITLNGTAYRIDGGPAIVDFQSFLTDLDQAVGQVLGTDSAFQSFAKSVLGPFADNPDDVAVLKADVTIWYTRYHVLVSRALPKAGWGPSRLDAVGMIFNRLTGLDLGPPPTNIIASNIRVADAPVRYPFLWNAPRQDQTQWPGFADNGNDILGLSRNLGEVFGVFAEFAPTPDPGLLHPLGIDYTSVNSANFAGLSALEGYVKKIGPPQWLWPIDQGLAARGAEIFKRKLPDVSCEDCHGIKAGKLRFLLVPTWATPVVDVQTDRREYQILGWTADTGVLQGAKIPLVTQPLKANDAAISVLATAVLGSIIQHYVPVARLTAQIQAQIQAQANLEASSLLPPELRDLEGAFHALGMNKPAGGRETATAPQFAYESRVLQGIWAAAPYLHNGSVPTLAELLKPPAQRVTSFKIGPAYDIVNVGLATEQTKFNYELQTTCEDLTSGNSRCGHAYGTDLSDDDKKALLEYLKTL